MSTDISKRPLNPEPGEQYRIAIPAQGAGDMPIVLYNVPIVLYNVPILLYNMAILLYQSEGVSPERDIFSLYARWVWGGLGRGNCSRRTVVAGSWKLFSAHRRRRRRPWVCEAGGLDDIIFENIKC